MKRLQNQKKIVGVTVDNGCGECFWKETGHDFSCQKPRTKVCDYC